MVSSEHSDGAHVGRVAALTQRLRDGEGDAWEELSEVVTRTLRARFRTRVDVDEAAAEALSDVYLGLGRLREETAILGFARRIAIRRATRQLRRSLEGSSIPRSEPLVHDDACERVEAEEMVRCVCAELTKSEVSLLGHIVRGTSVSEMRDLLGVTDGSIYSKRHRLRKKLSSLLRKHD